MSCDSETTIRKLFRAIQKLRLGNYFVRFRNYGSKIMDHTFILTLYHFKISTPSGNTFSRLWTSTTKPAPPLDNTLILTLYQFKLATPSGIYIHFHVHEQACQNFHALWTIRSLSYLHYTTSKLPPPLASTYIFTFMNKHIKIPAPSGQHVHTYIKPFHIATPSGIWHIHTFSRQRTENRAGKTHVFVNAHSEVMMGWSGGGMVTFLVLRVLYVYVATLQRSLVLLLRYMLLRCWDLWCCCYVICCYAADLWCCCYVICWYAAEISGVVATVCAGRGGGGMLTFLLLRTLYVARLLRSLV